MLNKKELPFLIHMPQLTCTPLSKTQYFNIEWSKNTDISWFQMIPNDGVPNYDFYRL